MNSAATKLWPTTMVVLARRHFSLINGKQCRCQIAQICLKPSWNQSEKKQKGNLRI